MWKDKVLYWAWESLEPCLTKPPTEKQTMYVRTFDRTNNRQVGFVIDTIDGECALVTQLLHPKSDFSFLKNAGWRGKLSYYKICSRVCVWRLYFVFRMKGYTFR